MKPASSSRSKGIPLFATIVGVTVLSTPSAQSDWHGHASIHRSANVNVNGWRGGHVDVHRDVHRDVDVHRDYDWDHHDHFWGGVAVGAAATIVTGAMVHSLPPVHSTVVVANTPYYYSSGVYYQTAPAGGYVAVAAPVGAILAALPPGSVPVLFGGQTFFYNNGSYYVQQGSTFVVQPTPIGVIVPALPPGATASVINGQTYFLHQGVYYQPVFQNGVTVYTTVKI